jgi:hypothetical protein
MDYISVNNKNIYFGELEFQNSSTILAFGDPIIRPEQSPGIMDRCSL